MAKNDRFVRIYTQGDTLSQASTHHVEIWVDVVTGVNYVYCSERGGCGGMTPLLGDDGKPVVFSKKELDEIKEGS
ncbi:MAG TPA: xylan 1,4-beta-xylosidase [Ruminococcus sp.]|mgnify:CR=1 FL=1|nr:xylan 1,4-beta-xylosidase [Ruminococcus sp.]